MEMERRSSREDTRNGCVQVVVAVFRGWQLFPPPFPNFPLRTKVAK